ncbi:Uncharacterised protein [Moraxella lacunata]|uniref:Uncharacterized protein n=1 Tax=Moraxella lacunata TaxID=477 RepID=A0A378TR22_MORLA|nr:hypothetical protein [Moraxella lacunata]STZ63258.1 Uncharacterised protein [Moraxella lacunata]
MSLENFDLKYELKNSNYFIWEKVDDEKLKNHLNNELKKEVDVGHLLYGMNLTAIFSYIDDVVYQFLENDKIAVVHLTYCSGKDTPPFPLCRIYDNLDDWYEKEFFQNLDYPLNCIETLNEFEKIVLGYALNFISNQDFEQYIYGLDEHNLPFNYMDYIDLISLNFNDKESVMLFLNEWYIKKFIEENCYDDWANDLMDFYTLAQ